MRCLLALVLLSLSSCSRSETARPAEDSGPARRPAVEAGPPPPLSAHCGTEPCRDYSAAVAAVRTRAVPGGCSEASIGRCGSARYVQFSDGFSAFEQYFDASGAMIAARTRADIDPSGGWYGPAQSCEKVPDDVLCHESKVDAGVR